MFFKAVLTIDPSQMTNIQPIPPTRAFGKMLHFLTAGKTSEKEERETFTAVSILQQFNRAFRAQGIRNIVRLARDGTDFYLDQEGRPDDLKEALGNFEAKVPPAGQPPFETLILVVEHDLDSLRILIEAHVQRRHQVGEHPISLRINALMLDLAKQPGQSSSDVQNAMGPLFQSQEAYDSYLKQREGEFVHFLDDLQQCLSRHIGVDRVTRQTIRGLIRPSQPIQDVRKLKPGLGCDPFFHGYHGFADTFLYAWLWLELLHQHNLPVHSLELVDESGHQLMRIGNMALFPADDERLNPSVPFPTRYQTASLASLHSYGKESRSRSSEGGGSEWLWGLADLSGCSGADCGGSCGGGCGGE